MHNNHQFADFAARLRRWMEAESSIPSRSAGENQFNQLALELFALQSEHNPAYQRICRARKVSPEQVKTWCEVPFVPVVAFKEVECTSIPPAERTAVFHSSGTTGQKPSRHFHSQASLELYEASLLPWFNRHCLPTTPNEKPLKFLFLTPPGESVPHSSLVYMFETIRRQHAQAGHFFAGYVEPDGSWSIDDMPATECLETAIQEQQPLALLGTAFNFVHFLDALSNTGKRLRLPAGSRVMETGGYKGRSRSMPKLELHAWICEMLGLTRSDILCEYGMSELSSQAYDWTVGRIGDVSSPVSSGSATTPNQTGDETSPIRTEEPCRSGDALSPVSSRSATTPNRTGDGTSPIRTEEPRRFRFPPWARVQLISPESGRELSDGEVGLIRIFDLANVYSIAALQTEDLGIRHGDAFQLLGRASETEPRGCSLMSKENLL